MLFRMAKQCLEANAAGEHAEVAGRVRLLDRRLQSVGVEGEAVPPDVLLAAEQQAKLAAAAGVPLDQLSSPDGGVLLPRRASLLVTDLLDHSVLGMGLLPALDYAAERLLAPGALVVPQRVQVSRRCDGMCQHGLHSRCLFMVRASSACFAPTSLQAASLRCPCRSQPRCPLLDPSANPRQVYACLVELRVGTVNGFDLSTLNAYWWHPGAERMELARMPHRRLSAPIPVHCLDLQARLDAALARHAAAANDGGAAPCNGSSSKHGAAEEASSPPSSSASSSREDGPKDEEVAWEHDEWLEVPVTADGHWNAVVFWFDVHAGGGAVVTSWGEGRGSRDAATSGSSQAAGSEAAAEGQSAAAASSWGQAVQYLDGQSVSAGSSARLRVRQDSGQLVFTSDPPQCRPRHALGAPGT